MIYPLMKHFYSDSTILLYYLMIYPLMKHFYSDSTILLNDIPPNETLLL